MPIQIIDKIKQKNNADFKIADAIDLNYNDEISVKEALDELYESGGGVFYLSDVKDIENLTSAKQGSLVYIPALGDADERLYIVHEVQKNADGTTTVTNYSELKTGGGTSTVPTLSYIDSMPEGERIYKTVDDDIVLQFHFFSSTYGNGNYRVYRDGSLAKSFSDVKGNVLINLGKLATETTYVFTVTATDYLGIPAPETLMFTVVVGGVKLTSTFDQTITNTVFETDSNITVPYTLSCSDTSAVLYIDCEIKDGGDNSIKQERIDVSSHPISGYWEVGTIPNRGAYTLTMQAHSTDGLFSSDKLEYKFNVLRQGEIAIISTFDSFGVNTDTYITIPFRVSTTVANYLTMRGTLFKLENGSWTEVKTTGTSGISCTNGITGYWSIGYLEQGTYKYELSATTIDGGIVSLEKAVEEFEITQSQYNRVEPVTANLMAWFDANDKRNSDSDRNIWYNKTSLGDSYRIYLTDLNYETNGWKHVDESLTDAEEGEYMLKFTGDSYGRLMRMNNGNPTPYNPFSIFSNSGIEGFAFECVFRTRNVGELSAKVVTCQQGTTTTTCGFSVGYDKIHLASNIQTMDLDFSENSWIHAVFVIDKNIRTMATTGVEMIENLNQIATMRIYINGVLCAANAITNDSFLDAGGYSYPLMINSCLVDGVAANFGECEIKLIRMYNNYLTSSDVLNNYIASIHDLTEQQQMKDRNDTTKNVLPTVIFKRKPTSSNKNTFVGLNSITDKAVSKKYCVDCVMEFNDGSGNIQTFDNVDVFLQGTSSLQYPVKNYKIKAYQDDAHSKKLKFAPSPKKDEWKPEYCYTLKVDFMESSHMNNTPTAVFYDQVCEAMGASSPARDAGYRDSIDGIPCIVYYSDDFESEGLTLVGSFMFNLDKESDNLGFEVGNCISYEGAANSSDTAGCFFSYDACMSSRYDTYLTASLEDYIKTSGNVIGMEAFIEGINNGTINYDTYEEFKAGQDEISYVMDDWEYRYSYCEDDGDDPSYRPMLELIEWVTNSTQNGTFKDEFEEHFNLKYCLIYYLQMMVFAQVDNCGKNMMMDTWDGKIFYPRPYDMDTQMGLSNTGTETIDADAELLPTISPFRADGTYAGYENSDTITQNRYLAYNTKTSKLWNNFAIEFANEIKSAYQQLRSAGVYSVDNIMTHMRSMTVDVIGEIYYNKDMASKYLSQVDTSSTEYLKALHGNRQEKYKKFITDRIMFCDTLYEYMESDAQQDTLNSTITLRSDAFYGVNSSEGTLKCYIGISSYSPMYVTINVGSGLDAMITAYVSPDSTYVDPDTGMTREGTLFSFPIKATDKEMIITGAGNIKEINRLEELNVRDLTIAKAQKISKLNLSNSTRMTALALGNNYLLRELDCSMSYLLGTGTGGQTLNLSQCVNLRTVNIAYTKITGITFPTNSNLTEVNLDGSSIKNVNIDGAEFLRDVSIENCVEIQNYELNKCKKLTTIDVSASTVRQFVATNCENLVELNLSECKQMVSFDVTNSPNIHTLRMTGNTGSIMNDLNLYTMYNLRALYANNTTSLNKIRFPKYANQEETDKAIAGQPAQLWTALQTLNITSSSIKYIQYGSQEITNGTCDMGQLENLTSLSFQNCTDVVSITNLNYTASSFVNMFNGCIALTNIQGTLTCSGTSVASMFLNCKVLEHLDNLTLNLSTVTNAYGAFRQCYKLKTPALKKLLDACGSSLQNIDTIAWMFHADGVLGSATDTTRTLSKDLFENTPNITSMSNSFCATKYTTINGDCFDNLTKLNNINACFGAMGELTTVGIGLLRNKPTLTNCYATFADCRKLANYITQPTIFEGSNAITNISQMFKNDTALKAPNGIDGMLDNLIGLTNAEYMFYNCKALVCAVPNGFFANNSRLTKLDGFFGLCSGLTQICDRLFRKELQDTNTFPSLTQARYMFSGCTNLTGIVSNAFFLGASEITDLGDGLNTTPWNSSSIFGNLNGFFADTKITGYFDTFLAPLTKLRNVRGMFYKTSANATLKNCYYYEGSTVMERSNTVSDKLFANNPSLYQAGYFFANNTSLVGCIPPNLYSACKKSIAYLSAAFYNCTGLTGTDLETGENIGIREEWFSGASSLINVSDFLRGCTNFSGSLPKDLFKGCTRLQTVSSMFESCSGLIGELPIELFNDCRSSLTATYYMFCNCKGLTGKFPTGVYSKAEGITAYKMCGSTTEGALKVVTTVTDPYTEVAYSTVVGISPDLVTVLLPDVGYCVVPIIGEVTKVEQYGLLANCTNLTRTDYMFHECNGLKGAIPNDIFYTDSLTKRYNVLTTTANMFYHCGFDKTYVDENTGIHYFCDANLLSKCPALTDISNMFRGIKVPSCQLYMNMFARQTVLQNASGLFWATNNLTGAITSTLFLNSLGTLTNVYGMFAFTNITSVVSGFLNNGVKNTKLQQVGAIFYNCSNITGASPSFWDGSFYTAIVSNQNGYYGALYNCTKLSNYSTAQAVSNNWTNNQNYVGY